MSVALTTLSIPGAEPSRAPRGSLTRGLCAIALAAALVGGSVAAGGCEGEQRARDASVAPSLQTGEISIRFDVSPQGASSQEQRAPAISVLAFHAVVSGAGPRDVLGVVDPLAAAGPERDCELRDLDLSASALAAQGGSIELQELSGIGLALSDFRHSPSTGPEGLDPTPSSVVRPFPRLFPDVATVVGGVVGELGPLPLATLPERVGLLTPASELPLEELAVPAAPRIVSVNGAPLAAGAKLETRDGLGVLVAGGAGAIVELRPFGATAAIACAVPGTGGEGTLVIPAALMARLLVAVNPTQASAGGGGVAASFDVLSRARVQVAPFTVPNHLSIEVRASTAVELRP
jgi:hypothetical protein